MKIIRKTQSEFRNLRLQLLSLLSSTKLQIENNVPYISQFASPEYSEKVLRDNVNTATDPKWQNTGAESPEEYTKWVLTICGMACTSMALKYFNNDNTGIVSLAKDAMKHNVYKEQSDDISDMHYREYADWITKYRLRAEVYSKLTIRGIKYLLSNGNLVIVSVNPNIREYTIAPITQKGGHLVLVTGYNNTNNTVTIHNPSGFSSLNTQQNHTIQISKFLQFYAGRGIAISSLSDTLE